MTDGICRASTKLFRGIYIALMVFVACSAAFNRESYGNNTVIVCVAAGLHLLAIAKLYRFLSGSRGAGVRGHFGRTLGIMAAVLLIVELALGFVLRFDPRWDLEAIFRGAIHWYRSGGFADYSSETCHPRYFYIFPNNIGGLCFYYLLFSAVRLFGMGDYWLAALVVNTLLLTGTMVFSACIARRLWGSAAGLLCAAMFLLSPPFWFFGPVFYTDSLSMMFPAAAWYCCMRAEETEKARRAAWFAAAGLCGAIGGMIKPTVWIILIAIAVVYILRGEWKLLMTFALLSSLLVGGSQLALHSAIYPEYLDPKLAEQWNMPTEYWLALGLSDEGKYRSDYFGAAMEPEGQAEKKAVLRELIAENVREKGFSGMLELFAKKMTRAFGDGTFALSDFLDDRPQEDTILHQFVLYDGEHYKLYASLCTGILAVQLFLAALGGADGKNGIRSLPAPMALFGLILFLSVWEVTGRYFVNYSPMIFITAVGGLVNWLPIADEVRLKLKRNENGTA